MPSSSLPVVAIGKDGDGLPIRLSVAAGLSKKATPIVLSGRRLGEVAKDGTVTWIAPGAAASFQEFGDQVSALREAKWARSNLRAAVIDGRVAAVVVTPMRRNTTNRKR